MRNPSFEGASWNRVVLAILPGFWLIVRYKPGFVTSVSAEALTSVIALILAFGLVAASLYDKQRIMPWSLPGLGVVIFQIWYLIGYVQYRRRAGLVESINGVDSFRRQLTSSPSILPLLIGGVLAIIICACSFLALYWIYRKFKGLMTSQSVWGLVCLVATSAATMDYLAYYPYKGYISGALINATAFSLPFLLGPIALGFSLAKNDGLAAGLLVMSCTPLWIEVISNPSAAIHAQMMRSYPSPTSGLEVAWLILSYLPFINSFLVTPIGLLRSRSIREQRRWLLVPLFLTLLSMNIIRYFALSGTAYEYSWVTWLRSGLAFIQIWIPVLLTAMLYDRILISRQNSP